MNKLLLIFSIILLSPLTAFCQPTVNICVSKTSSQLEVLLIPDGPFDAFFPNVQFTIKADQPGISFQPVVQASPEANYIPIQAAGATSTVGSTSYQKFVGWSTITLDSAGAGWTGTQNVILFQIIPSDLNATYEIASDSWSSSNNGAYYVELNGKNHTGTQDNTCNVSFAPAMELEGVLQEEGSLLQWTTFGEAMNTRFQIERATIDQVFETIASIEGTSSHHNYSWTDEKVFALAPARVFYRIKAVDADGQYSFSNQISVYVGPLNTISVFPNPTTGQVFVELPAAPSTKIAVYDLLGTQIQVEELEEHLTTTHVLDLEGIASGRYLLQVRQRGEIMQEILVVE